MSIASIVDVITSACSRRARSMQASTPAYDDASPVSDLLVVATWCSNSSTTNLTTVSLSGRVRSSSSTVFHPCSALMLQTALLLVDDTCSSSSSSVVSAYQIRALTKRRTNGVMSYLEAHSRRMLDTKPLFICTVLSIHSHR